MRFPNKLYSFNESTLAYCQCVMEALEKNDEKECDVLKLYSMCKKKINTIAIFMDTLEALYALKKIDFDSKTRRIKKC